MDVWGFIRLLPFCFGVGLGRLHTFKLARHTRRYRPSFLSCSDSQCTCFGCCLEMETHHLFLLSLPPPLSLGLEYKFSRSRSSWATMQFKFNIDRRCPRLESHGTLSSSMLLPLKGRYRKYKGGWLGQVSVLLILLSQSSVLSRGRAPQTLLHARRRSSHTQTVKTHTCNER